MLRMGDNIRECGRSAAQRGKSEGDVNARASDAAHAFLPSYSEETIAPQASR